MFSRVLADALNKREDALAADAETLFRMVNSAADEVHTLMNSLERKNSGE